jgi:hypothetical protein
MDIKTFIKSAAVLPAHISILAKGPTGIGKSHIFHSLAKKLDMPVIDRRLSQMTEGDIIGLPELIDGVTRFAPVNWYIQACKEPVVLFFDELNRATLEVQQCAFQIVLDRELNGHKLHPKTRVYAAINEGSEYQVLDMDPALLRRFWTVDLEPTVQDWLAWAYDRKDVPKVMQEFINENPGFLRHVKEKEPGKVYPNPASWHRLGETLVHANLDPDSYAGSRSMPDLLFPLCMGFVGSTATTKFIGFLQDYTRSFSAEDVANNYPDVKEKLNEVLNEDKKNDLIEKIMLYLERNHESLTLEQIANISEYIKDCPDEMTVNFFNLVMETKQINMIRKFHKHLGALVTKLVKEDPNKYDS